MLTNTEEFDIIRALVEESRRTAEIAHKLHKILRNQGNGHGSADKLRNLLKGNLQQNGVEEVGT